MEVLGDHRDHDVNVAVVVFTSRLLVAPFAVGAAPPPPLPTHSLGRFQAFVFVVYNFTFIAMLEECLTHFGKSKFPQHEQHLKMAFKRTPFF